MLRIDQPTISYMDVLNACETQITRNQSLQLKLSSTKVSLTSAATDYSTRAANAMLFQISCVASGNPVVLGSLKKDELVKLYEYYFREKGAGGYYDKFMIAVERCPFCGGIGQPANLDHFMPKSGFPQFSVLPVNLIPSCRDCNMGSKGSAFATSASEQILHPFLDQDHFFDEQWIFARYNAAPSGSPTTIDYYVDPPANWSTQDKGRVRKHFSDFCIGKRYGEQASTALGDIEAQIEALTRVDPAIDFRTVILWPVVNQYPFVNHWKRVMCLTMIAAL